MKKLFPILLLAILLLPLVSAAMPYPGNEYQNHNYYVVFDEEGEAAILAQISITNPDELKTLELELPGEQFRIISVYQLYYEQLDEEQYWRTETVYKEVDYTIEELSESILLNLEIPKPDEENIQLYIYYKSESYVTQKGGVYSYDFETMMSDMDINYVSVSVDVTEDLYIKDGSTSTDYKSSFAAGDYAVSEMAYMPYPYSNNQKTTQALDPHESFHVTGKYANSWFSINWWKVVLGILITGIIIFGTVFGIKKGIKDKKLKLSVLIGVLFGFLTSMIWLAFIFLVNNLRNIIGYQYSDMFGIFLIMIVILLTVILIASPPVFIGLKHGLKQGIWCLVALVITLTIFLILGMFATIFLSSNSEPIYRTMMDSVAMAEPAIME
ncbi:MAG: hypothetical protein ABIJ18_00740 [archaeon]